MAKKAAQKKRFVYKFTAEHGPEQFPTLGVELTKKGEVVESDELIDHPRLKRVLPTAKQSAPKEVKKSEPKEVEGAKDASN